MPSIMEVARGSTELFGGNFGFNATITSLNTIAYSFSESKDTMAAAALVAFLLNLASTTTLRSFLSLLRVDLLQLSSSADHVFCVDL